MIPYYETYDLTCKILDSLVKQKTDEVEVFVIDDACNETRLDKYKKDINIVHLEENVGGGPACNEGMKRAKGKYIAIIDSDDMISDEYVKTLIEAIDTRDDDVIYFDWQDIANGVVIHHPHNYAPWKAIYKKSIMPYFKSGLRYSYDVPFQEELSEKDYTYSYIDKVLYYYYSNREGNLTSQKEIARREEMITVEVIEEFTLERFDELVDIKRKSYEQQGRLFVGDTFKCEKEMAQYLMGNNHLNRTVVKVVEVKPKVDKKEEKVYNKPTKKGEKKNGKKEIR